MPEKTPMQIVLCPECRAENPIEADRCWLCGRMAPRRPSDTARTPGGGVRSAADSDREAWEYLDTELAASKGKGVAPSRHGFGLTSILLLFALGVILFGVFHEQRGLAILLVIVLSPALVVAYGTQLKRSLQGRPMSGKEFQETFGKSVVATAHVLSVMASVLVSLVLLCGLAMIIYIYIICSGGRVQL